MLSEEEVRALNYANEVGFLRGAVGENRTRHQDALIAELAELNLRLEGSFDETLTPREWMRAVAIAKELGCY